MIIYAQRWLALQGKLFIIIVYKIIFKNIKMHYFYFKSIINVFFYNIFLLLQFILYYFVIIYNYREHLFLNVLFKNIIIITYFYRNKYL